MFAAPCGRRLARLRPSRSAVELEDRARYRGGRGIIVDRRRDGSQEHADETAPHGGQRADVRGKGPAEERDPLVQGELRGAEMLGGSVKLEVGLAGRPKVADPMDLAKRADDPPAAIELDDGDRRAPRVTG